MARGKLEAFTLFKVVRSIHERRSNGVLTLSSGGSLAKIRFAMGKPVQVQSSQGDEGLGPALVQKGLISTTEYEELLSSQADTRKPFEQLVLERDLVARPRLQRIESKLARGRLLETFGWAEGEFEFRSIASHEEALIEPIEPIDLILEAVARVIPTPLCGRFLKKFPGQYLRGTEWVSAHRQRFEELFRGGSLLDRLSEGVTADGVSGLTGDRANNLRQATALILSGLCKLHASHVGGEVHTPTAASASRTPKSTEDPDATRPDNSAGPTGRPASGRPAATRPQRVSRPVAATQRVVGSPEPSRVVRPPNVRSRTIVTAPPAAGAPVVEATTDESARAPRNSRPPQRPGAPSRRPQVAKARRRTEPAPQARRVAPAASGVQGSSSAAVSSAKAAADTDGRSIPADMPEKDRKRLEGIFAAVDALEGKNHYEVLGIAKNASEKMIRHAFRKMAREYHVDRFSRYDLNRETLLTIQKVFIALNRAHETLVDAHDRQEYDVSLEFARQAAARSGGRDGRTEQDAHLQNALRAEQMVQTAIAIIARGDAAAAVGKFREALDYTPEDPLAKAGLAYAEYLVSKSQGGSASVVARTVDVLNAVTASTNQLAEPYLYLGRVHRDQGDHASAVEAFASALRVNPHLSQAASELRFAKKRLTEAKGGLKGLFGRKK